MNNKCLQHRPITLLACSTLALSGAVAQAQSASPAPESSSAQFESLQQQLSEQGRQIDALKRMTTEQEKKYQALRRALRQQSRDAQPGETAQGANAEQATPNAQAEQNPADTSQQPVQVGIAPSQDSQPPVEVPRLFEQPGILTPKGKFVFEPSLEYSYSSNNRVALIGYTIIPALVIGLIDVQQVKDSILTGALTGRYGLTNRMEVEAKIPYVYRSDSSVGRELNTGSATDSVFNSSGKAIGDVEVTARYQLNEGSATKPYLIGSLRFKSRTGKDPFEVVTDCLTSCVGNPGGTGLPTTQPTGSGFYLLQPALTWLF